MNRARIRDSIACTSKLKPHSILAKMMKSATAIGPQTNIQENIVTIFRCLMKFQSGFLKQSMNYSRPKKPENSNLKNLKLSTVATIGTYYPYCGKSLCHFWQKTSQEISLWNITQKQMLANTCRIIARMIKQKGSHSSKRKLQINITKQINISMLPMKQMSVESTLVFCLLLMQLAITSIPQQNAENRKGKGTTDPGAGTQAVLASLISNPSLHWYSSGTQPLPRSLTLKPRGQMSPTKTHQPRKLGSYLSGQNSTQVLL